MVLRGFDHDGRRWMEGDFEGQMFALDEDGERLMLKTPLYGFRLFQGATTPAADRFSGVCVGTFSDGKRAFAWLHGDPVAEPTRIMAGTASVVTVPLGDDDATAHQ